MKKRRLGKQLWKGNLEVIKTYAKAHGLSDTAKQVDEILKWLEQDDSAKKKE